MKNLFLIIVTTASLFVITSCEKVIDLKLNSGKALPYVDGWITNKPGVQSIRFLRAANYLDDQLPQPIADAQIRVTDLTASVSYDFVYSNGSYTYNPGNGNSIGVIGHEYKLSIAYNGDSYEAVDKLNRVTAIDSITYEYRKQSGQEKEGYYAKLYAKDLSGATDYGWVRTYRNGKLNKFVSEMIFIDAAYEEGLSDGFEFILPIQSGITSSEKPYQKGDEVKVLLRSLSQPSHRFMTQVLAQLANGGLFSTILQNVPSNISNLKGGNTNKIYGWFGTVAETDGALTIQ